MLRSAMLLCFMLLKWLQNEVQNGSKMVPKWLQNGAWEPPDGVQNLILAPLASWRALGAPWTPPVSLLGAPGSLLDAPEGLLVESGTPLERSWSPPGTLLDPPGGVLRAPGALLEAS